MDDSSAAVAAVSPPDHILGYTIRSHTRIYVSYLLPAALGLFVYIAQILADIAVSYQHFRSGQADFGWATLSLILIPPALTFIFVLSSKDQWSNPRHKSRLNFVCFNLLQLLLFPFFAIYRFAKRIFWSVEALFQKDNDAERMKCLALAEECSTCELYHLIQAYGQSAPQIILQLFHMLSQDLFRNFQTTDVQAISLVFSAIDLAAITTTYQRFESQHQVGRHYPWSAPKQIEDQQRVLTQHQQYRSACELKKRASERTISSFPESDKIMANFNSRRSTNPTSLTHELHIQDGFDEVDDNENEPIETTALIHQPVDKAKTGSNATDDDKIRKIPKLRLHSISEESKDINAIEVLDTAPDTPAPLPPVKLSRQLSQTKRVTLTEPSLLRSQVSTQSDASTASARRLKRNSKALSQLETFKDMLLVNAQLYIKEHVPRPPKLLIKGLEDEQEQPLTPGSPHDVVDFFLPRPTKVVNGIQQDDFAGKTIAFFGWVSFIIMRMLSLSTFCVFYPKAFFIVLSVHYLIAFAALCLESCCKDKLNRTLFYMLLSYVYIFVLLEFRIKFKHLKCWLIGFFIITMTENIVITMLWYAREEFESWWFGFIFDGIMYSGILLVATLLVYYCILRPKDVMLVVATNDESDIDTKNTV